MIELGCEGLTAAEVVRVARAGEHVSLGDAAREAMAASRAIVDRLAASELPVYGARGRLAPTFFRGWIHGPCRLG